jgi:hypothetical protein
VSATDLLVPEAFLPIDTLEYLRYIEHNYPGLFLDNPKGVYKLGRIDPVLTDGNYYYTKAGLAIQKPIENIDNVFEDVYDANGRIVINAMVMRNKRKFLSNTSQYSYYGVRAINYYVNMIIENHSAYIKNRRYLDKFLSCFKPEYRQDIHLQNIDIDFTLEPLHSVVYAFIAKHPWTIYLTKQLGTMCLIEKTIDYRIYDWTIQKEQEEQRRAENMSEQCDIVERRVIRY